MRDRRRIVKGWRGRLVRLNYRIQTMAGDVWDAGEVMRVTGTWRSGVHLEPVDRDPLEDNRRGIHHVHRGDVTLLAPVPHPALLRELEEQAGGDVLVFDDNTAEPLLAAGLIEAMAGCVVDVPRLLDRAEELDCPHTRIRDVLAWLEENDKPPDSAPAYRITDDGWDALARERERREAGESWRPPRLLPDAVPRAVDDPKEMTAVRRLIAKGRTIDVAAERKRSDLFVAYERTGCTTKRRVATLTHSGITKLMAEFGWCLAWNVPNYPIVVGRKAWENMQ